MIVIGLLGEKAGGKGAFVEILKELVPDGVIQLRSSDLLLEAPTKSLHITRQNVSRGQLIALAIAYERIFGKGCISRAMQQRIDALDAPVVVFDGIRWPSDVAAVRVFLDSLFIYVTADARIRWKRAQKRNEKAGEKTATFRQFLAQEKAKTERYIGKIGREKGVIRITNNGSLEEFREKVKRVYEEHIKTAL